MLETNLAKILKAENGTDDKSLQTRSIRTSTDELNTRAFENSVRYLKQKTGRSELSFEDIMDPDKAVAQSAMHK